MIETPEFGNEPEEALWWEQNQALVLEEFKQASKAETLGRGTLSGRCQTPTITIRLDPGDQGLV